MKHQKAPAPMTHTRWVESKPMWVIGSIDIYGAIHFKVGKAGGREVPMHDAPTSIGHRWRWNVHGQDWVATKTLDRLTGEEFAAVTEWLDRHGYIRH